MDTRTDVNARVRCISRMAVLARRVDYEQFVCTYLVSHLTLRLLQGVQAMEHRVRLGFIGSVLP